MVKEIVKKGVVLFALIAMVFFAGCSSSKDPVITNIEVQDKKLEGDVFTYKIRVDVAIDRELENPTSYIVRLSAIGSDYTRDLDGGFMTGQRNSHVTFNQRNNGYSGDELEVKIELIQGTKILDTKTIKYSYE